MRKIFFLGFFILFASLQLIAQTFRIDTAEVSFENKQRACLLVKYDASAKTVKNAWASYLKKNYKIKVKGISLISNKDIVDAEDVTISSIADKRMNMYASVIDIAGGSEMKYFMSFGYDFFIGPSNYGKEFGRMHKLLNDFSISFLNDYYADEISGILKKVKGFERDIKVKNKAIDNNIKKSKKESDTIASGLDAKNYSLKLEIEQLQSKIEGLKKDIEIIKGKQEGIIAK